MALSEGEFQAEMAVDDDSFKKNTGLSLREQYLKYHPQVLSDFGDEMGTVWGSLGGDSMGFLGEPHLPPHGQPATASSWPPHLPSHGQPAIVEQNCLRHDDSGPRVGEKTPRNQPDERHRPGDTIVPLGEMGSRLQLGEAAVTNGVHLPRNCMRQHVHLPRNCFACLDEDLAHAQTSV